jgi:hypothetical protein
LAIGRSFPRPDYPPRRAIEGPVDGLGRLRVDNRLRELRLRQAPGDPHAPEIARCEAGGLQYRDEISPSRKRTLSASARRSEPPMVGRTSLPNTLPVRICAPTKRREAGWVIREGHKAGRDAPSPASKSANRYLSTDDIVVQ